MVLNHIAAIFFFSGPLFYIGLVMVVDPAGIAALPELFAIFFFSGPLFYIGLVMVVDPAGIAALPELFAHALRNFRRALGGQPAQTIVELEQAGTSHRLRRTVRLAGLALVVCGLFAAVV